MSTPPNARTVIGEDLADDEEEAATVVVTDLSQLGIDLESLATPKPANTPLAPDPTRTFTAELDDEPPAPRRLNASPARTQPPSAEGPVPDPTRPSQSPDAPDLRRIQRSMRPVPQDDRNTVYYTIVAVGLAMTLVGGGAFAVTALLVWS